MLGIVRCSKLIGLLALAACAVACSSKQAEPGASSPGAKLPAPVEDLPLAPGEPRAVVLAGGCFWCTEAVFEDIKGVQEVISGYAGGGADTANYRAVSSGDTGHAEVVRVVYDPGIITYGALLRVFFATHDPTQVNRQGPDVGTQYRSAIFYATEDEKQLAQAYIDQLTEAKIFAQPIATKLEPLNGFFAAENYHQDYARRNPNEPYIQTQAQPKMEKLKQVFPELLDKDSKR